MPAVTVDDVLAVPPIAVPRGDGGRSRPVVSVTVAPEGYEGEGFPVRRAFAGVDLSLLDPFVHLDQMGEVDYGPGEPKGTAWHPHRGFETVTYMLDGTMQHRDSTGGGGVISNGDTQWMTAGAGIQHIETPPEELVVSGGLFHGFQLWVNLPAARKWVPPRYQDIAGERITLLRSSDGGALVRLIAGDLGDAAGPGVTHTPITLVHATLAPGARLVLPWPRRYNALVYSLAGRGTVGDERRPLERGQLAVFGTGDHLVVDADATPDRAGADLDVLILGGEPIGEPVAWYGPFVMNSRAELVQAFEDFRAGRLGALPADTLTS
ncbi:MAG TPA: pirin family protein [Acidimicrobiales bacterium]|nr:pirin family protein [Acidimicrobiales bacterium]